MQECWLLLLQTASQKHEFSRVWTPRPREPQPGDAVTAHKPEHQTDQKHLKVISFWPDILRVTRQVFGGFLDQLNLNSQGRDFRLSAHLKRTHVRMFARGSFTKQLAIARQVRNRSTACKIWRQNMSGIHLQLKMFCGNLNSKEQNCLNSSYSNSINLRNTR